MDKRMVLPHSVTPRLRVALRQKTGTLDVDVKFDVQQAWTILFGPSGSGKTTVLRAIAGLDRPVFAEIAMDYVDSGDMDHTAKMVSTPEGRFIPCHRRFAPLATQRATLFPHMSVREQIVYGMTIEWGGKTVVEKTDEMLALFRVTHVADRLPTALSGGEAQRVHLARTAARATGLLLLDEPFSGLESTLRSEIIGDLKMWAAERRICVLSVTHDVAEAFELNAEVIKLAEGRVVDQGPVERVLAEERNRLLAQLNGAAGSPA